MVMMVRRFVTMLLRVVGVSAGALFLMSPGFVLIGSVGHVIHLTCEQPEPQVVTCLRVDTWAGLVTLKRTPLGVIRDVTVLQREDEGMYYAVALRKNRPSNAIEILAPSSSGWSQSAQRQAALAERMRAYLQEDRAEPFALWITFDPWVIVVVGLLGFGWVVLIGWAMVWLSKKEAVH